VRCAAAAAIRVSRDAWGAFRKDSTDDFRLAAQYVDQLFRIAIAPELAL
jgi:hypothetical protein